MGFMSWRRGDNILYRSVTIENFYILDVPFKSDLMQFLVRCLKVSAAR